MTPTPQEPRQWRDPEMSPKLSGDSIVISGMSGAFPQSNSVKELSDILYNKVNPVPKENLQWKWKHPEASQYIGKVPGVERFDPQFFMVHHRLAHWMDPMARKALENSYQAIYDAGLSPKHLNGMKVGVYIASALSDAEKTGFTDSRSKTGFGISGCSKTMIANRISYWLNAKGPSMSLDDACCGSMVALEEAFNALNSGVCEAAIVGGVNLNLLPQSQVHYNRCIKISSDDKTKSFDESADGCTKSEAISVLFLQKAKNALRAYAEIVHIKNEFISKLSGETGQLFGFLRNPDETAAFLKQFYLEANVPPQAVQYVEAFGSADPEADKSELEAIEKVFCDHRTDPLYVGSVISNVGYTEAASGGTAVTKVLLGYHNGVLASNLHCEKPREDVAAIRDGRLRVVREHLPFRGSLAAVNCLSLTGVNSHVLLRGWTKTKDLNKYRTSIPRLLNVSARQQEDIAYIFEELKSYPIDPEKLALLHNIHSTNISGHLGRGYIILDMNENKQTISLSEKIEYFDDSQRPLWFVYSGMGSQWTGMGAQLMRIPIFAAAIERCRKVLEPKGIDIVHIITSPDKSIFDNILHSFVGIAAIQIGLTDIMNAIGLLPEKIIGHSVGELGCAYADGCLTAEEMILSAYSRGMASKETPLIRGAMAAVGLGYTQLSRLCPPEIEIACHNGPESSTISGPAESLREFVASLTAQGIFAKEVPCSNIAYHSRYIADAGPNLLRRCSEILPNPRARSARWVSTSVPQERWDEPLAQYCSAEYLTNNLLSPVLFEETSTLIPSNAVLIEIAPHGLLQAILRRSLPQTCTNLSLAKRGHTDNVLFLLEAIGKLYIEGYTPQVQALYPKVEFPVSAGTSHLDHLVKWYHNESWTVMSLNEQNVRSSSCAKYSITKHDDDYQYLSGCIIQGRVLFPFAATLVTVWDTLAITIGLPKNKISVRFSDIYLYSQPILHDQKSLKLSVTLNKGNGRFEVLEGDSKVATGYVFYIHKLEENRSDDIISSQDEIFTSEDIYEHLRSRGYSYRDEFRSIHRTNESLTAAQIIWNNNWVTLIDGLIQLNTLKQTHEGVTQPTHIRNLTINMEQHIVQRKERNMFDANIDKILDCTRCGGITIHNIKYRVVASFPENKLKLTPMLIANGTARAGFENLSRKTETKEKHIDLHIGKVGDLDTLLWKQVSDVAGNGVRVMVEYSGISTADMNRATKQLSAKDNEKYFGMDFSGLTESGECVMGIVREGSCRSIVRARSELLWPVPAHWSLEDAATVPLAYVQAYYCLCIKSELKAGTRVLIHGGAGALGQAAISIALSRGCQVFTTVSDTSKKRHLVKLFPELNEDWIGNSRNDTFGDMVLNATNGEGCEIVISCVKGNLKNISLKCAASFGSTFDTAQILNQEQYDYGMNYMTTSRSYILADFSPILNLENTALAYKLQRLVSDGICSGEVRPLSRVTYSPTDAARAFRLLAASRHRGRVLLRLRDSEPHTIHSFVCSSESSHLIICDGSALGLQFAQRLVSRGVKKLRILTTKSTSHHQIKILMWQEMGVDVRILSDNFATNSFNTISTILNETNQCGPLEGIYVIAAAAAENGDVNRLNMIVDALDTASRVTCPLLKYFGVITIDSNIGHQTCISRSKEGYPVTALKLPANANEVNSECLNDDLSSWNRSAVDVIEEALGSDIAVQIARPQPIQEQSLVTLVPAIAGDETGDCTLQDLGITESLPFIKSYLNDVYQIAYNDEEILGLTKKKILEIEMESTESKWDNLDQGLGTFISNVDLDELHATTDFLPLDTLVHEVKTMQDELDLSKPHLFVIPGLEGHHARFRTLCEHLKLPALVLQPGLDRPGETPRELALRYSKILLEKLKLKDNFHLLAYECGIFAALELAGILEDNGLTGTVYCIGDGPEETKALLEAQVSSYKSEEELQRGVVRHMFALMTGGAAPPAAVEGCSSWSARVDACVRALLGRVPHTAQYVRALLQAAYERIVTVRSYDIVPRALRSRLVLLRVRDATEPPSRASSLRLFSRRTVRVRELAAPMARAAYDLRAPAIVNSYLDEGILNAYKNTNLCTTYTY